MWQWQYGSEEKTTKQAEAGLKPQNVGMEEKTGNKQ